MYFIIIYPVINFCGRDSTQFLSCAGASNRLIYVCSQVHCTGIIIPKQSDLARFSSQINIASVFNVFQQGFWEEAATVRCTHSDTTQHRQAAATVPGWRGRGAEAWWGALVAV